MRNRRVVRSGRRDRVGVRPAGRSRLLTCVLFVLPLFVDECPSQQLYVVGHLHRYADTGSLTMDDRSERIAAIHRMGFGGTRLGFEWSQLEPSPGDYAWGSQDSILAELEGAGVRAYGMIGYSPEWARPADTRQTHRPLVGGSAARGDTAFAAFAAATARRYRGRIDRWEVWNEPNILHFWVHMRGPRNQGPDPADYAALFRLAADSIRAANPDAVVSTAGLSPGPSRLRRSFDQATGYPAAAYLDSLLALGIRPQAIAIHPYTRRPGWLNVPPGTALRPSNRVLNETLAVMGAHGLERTPVWITEWGVDIAQARSDADAMAWFSSELRYLICHPRVTFVTIYALQDRGGTRDFSLLRRDGSLTANGRALATLLGNWTAC